MAGKLAPPLNPAQVQRAVDALINHAQRSKKANGKVPLLDDADPISVLIGMKTIPATNGRTKPYLITLQHPMMDPEETEVCLIVKDPQREFKDKIEAKGIKSVKKVIGVSKLKAKFKQYEAKRQLCASYDLFLADDRVLPMLPHLLGKVFFEKKKQPLPVKLTQSNWDGQFESIFNATPFYLAEGLCSTIKVGHTGMDRAHIASNIVAALGKVADLLPKKWQGIQAIHIKTHDSIALPIYHALPNAAAIDLPASSGVPPSGAAAGTKASKRKDGEGEVEHASKRKNGEGEGGDKEGQRMSAKRRRFEKRAESRKAEKATKQAAARKSVGTKQAAAHKSVGKAQRKPGKVAR